MVLKFRWDKEALWWWVNGHYIAGNSDQVCKLLLNDPVDFSSLYQAVNVGGVNITFIGAGGGGAGGSSSSTGSGGNGGSGVINTIGYGFYGPR